MLIWKTYLEQHLSSELKKEKNKTEMDWTSVSKWKYRNRLLMACHLLVRHKMSPLYCSHTYSYYCDQNTLRAMWSFSIWWQACRGQLGPLMAESTMWVMGTQRSFSLIIDLFFLDLLYTTSTKLCHFFFTDLNPDLENMILLILEPEWQINYLNYYLS